jgi:hypothetical protein
MIVLLLLVMAAAYYLWIKHEAGKSLVLISVLVISFVNLELNTVFYPRLLKYQSASEAIFFMDEEGISSGKLASYKCWHQSLAYYLDADVPVLSKTEHLDKIQPGTYLFTTDEGLGDLREREIEFKLLKTFDHYHVTLLTANFLNPSTRPEVLSKRYLVKLL